MVVPVPAEGVHLERDLNDSLSRSEDWISYKLTFRCKRCGNEWSKISEKEVELPRDYVKSEYEDADRPHVD